MNTPRGGTVWRAVKATEVLMFVLITTFLLLVVLVQESANAALAISPFAGADAVLFLLPATRVVCIVAVASSTIAVWALWRFARSRSKARLVSYALLSAGCILALIRSPLGLCYVWNVCVN